MTYAVLAQLDARSRLFKHTLDLTTAYAQPTSYLRPSSPRVADSPRQRPMLRSRRDAALLMYALFNDIYLLPPHTLPPYAPAGAAILKSISFTPAFSDSGCYRVYDTRALNGAVPGGWVYSGQNQGVSLRLCPHVPLPKRAEMAPSLAAGTPHAVPPSRANTPSKPEHPPSSVLPLACAPSIAIPSTLYPLPRRRATLRTGHIAMTPVSTTPTPRTVLRTRSIRRSPSPSHPLLANPALLALDPT
ncbi:hypothetical protein B0H13DRAFT_2343320 [Mycena leptocephala]|nr:hypothetical protein B0H13DRAFT_2343320 [Mycena leptocephala]